MVGHSSKKLKKIEIEKKGSHRRERGSGLSINLFAGKWYGKGKIIIEIRGLYCGDERAVRAHPGPSKRGVVPSASVEERRVSELITID